MTHATEHAKSFLLTLLLVIGAAGCGGADGDGYSGERGSVSGKVTLGDAPLVSGCQIIFMSTKGGYTGAGVIGEGGTYTLNYSDSRGLPAGEYQIQFTAPITPAPAAQAVDPAKMAQSMKLTKKTKTEGDSGPFPTKYGSTLTSKMSFTVKGGENTADFKLEK